MAMRKSATKSAPAKGTPKKATKSAPMKETSKKATSSVPPDGTQIHRLPTFVHNLGYITYLVLICFRKPRRSFNSSLRQDHDKLGAYSLTSEPRCLVPALTARTTQT